MKLDKKQRVLIVDDEPKILKIFGLKLKLTGFEVVTTTSGIDAIELVRSQKFDVILLDMLMPDISGMDVLREIRSFSQIPIIMFTARDNIFEMAKQSGANGYIPKPVNPDDLIKKIKAVLDENDSGATKPKL